jgi:hypothetical protein
MPETACLFLLYDFRDTLACQLLNRLLVFGRPDFYPVN